MRLYDLGLKRIALAVALRVDFKGPRVEAERPIRRFHSNPGENDGVSDW